MKNVDLLLINPPFHRRNGSGTIFPLGLGYILAAVNINGLTSDVIDCSHVISTYEPGDLNKLKEYLQINLKSYTPTLVGIGPCITTQVKSLKIISDCCKDIYRNDRIFAGGPLASIDGQEWFFFDFLGLQYIVKGDGEKAIVEMLKCAKKGAELSECKYVTRRNFSFFNEIEDISNISYPQRPFIEDNIISTRRMDGHNKTATMITSRGCLYNCKYCVSGNMKYKQFRKRSYNDIIDEMQYLKEKYKITDIIFYDDCFFYNPQKVHQDVFDFCSMLIQRKVGMTWQMEIRCDLFEIMNDRDVMLLYQSGCRQINLGIEKVSISGLKYLGKNISLNGLADQIKYVKNISKIKIAGTFILGGKDETRENIEHTIEVSTNMNLDFAHYNPLFIYPGTPIYQECFHNEKDWVDYIMKDTWPWGEIVYQNKYVSREQLLELVNYAYEKFYEESSYKNSIMVKDRFNLNSRGK